MRATLFACLFITLQFSAYSQKTAPKETNKWTDAEHSQMEKAQLFFNEKNYRLAFTIFEKLQAKHPAETNLKYLCGVSGLHSPGKQAVCLQF